MTDEIKGMDDLEALFSAARADRPVPSGALQARVLADAVAVQDGVTAAAHAAPSRAARPGWIAQIAAALGGWPGIGGLATACAAGVWIGFAPPSSWPDPASLVVQDQTSFDLFQNEDLALIFVAEDG